MSLPHKDWDPIDSWAERFGKWGDLSRAIDLPKKKSGSYIPSCYSCFGTGHRIKDLLTQEIETCEKCKGTGLRRPKPKFLDDEIKDIVNKLGTDKVQKMIKNYGNSKRKLK